VTTAQAISEAGLPFVFSDGHGLATPITQWFDDLGRLDQIDWDMVNQRYWTDNVNDMDRQRRKQAEFLVSNMCPWALIQSIVVMTLAMKERVEHILGLFPLQERKLVEVKRDWYYH